jgi:hypothetical protein
MASMEKENPVFSNSILANVRKRVLYVLKNGFYDADGYFYRKRCNNWVGKIIWNFSFGGVTEEQGDQIARIFA